MVLKSIPASLAFTETYRQHAPTSIKLTLHVQPGVLTTLILLVALTCSILSGEASMPGTKLEGQKAACSTSAK